MYVIVPDASLRPFVLIGLNYMFQPVSEHRFCTLEELAVAAAWAAPAVESNRRSCFPIERHAVRQKALNPRGKTLSMEELIAWGRRQATASNRQRLANDFEFRRGSVPGVRTWRGGRSNRAHRVQSERRANTLVVQEEGEVSARATRRGRNLPDERDGRRRIVQRSWKSHFKGSKNWDR